MSAEGDAFSPLCLLKCVETARSRQGDCIDAGLLLHNRWCDFTPFLLCSALSVDKVWLRNEKKVIVKKVLLHHDWNNEACRKSIHHKTPWNSFTNTKHTANHTAKISGLLSRSPGLTEAGALLSLGEVFEAIGCASLGFLVLLDVPRQLGGDVGDKVAARSQTVIVSSHPELTDLGDKTQISLMSSVFNSRSFYLYTFSLTKWKATHHLHFWHLVEHLAFHLIFFMPISN